jgi:hypothetical protein
VTRIDQFESAFNAASKTLFEYREVAISSVLIVTDLDADAATEFGTRVVDYLSVLAPPRGLQSRSIGDAQFTTIEDLLRLVESEKPDLVCTYRALKSDAWRWGHSLGEHLDVLTQVASVPVLVLPHPRSDKPFQKGEHPHDSIMAMTDHLVGDHRLVSYALKFTSKGGTLHLANVEGRGDFERYMDAISKIPTIDTDNARKTLLEQLLKEPRDFAASCATVVDDLGLEVKIREAITVGEHLADYRHLITERSVDMLVLNTKEDEQMAMHGLAYPLAVELRNTPLLLL